MALALRRALQRGRAYRRLRAQRGGAPKVALPFLNRRISTGRLLAPHDREIRLTAGNLELRLIQGPEELEAAQRLLSEAAVLVHAGRHQRVGDLRQQRRAAGEHQHGLPVDAPEHAGGIEQRPL